MPIPLGILAQFRQAAAGDFVLLESQVLSSNQSSVTFSNLATLAAGYKHLQIRVAARTSAAEVLSGVRVRLGTGSIDSGANYSAHQLYGFNGSVISGAGTSQTAMFASAVAGANAASNIFGAVVIDLLDPFVSTKNTTSRTLGGIVAGTGTSAYISLESSAWLNTAAVEQASVLPVSGNWVTGSRFSLYGIRG